MKIAAALAASAVAALTLSGCSTLMHGPTQSVGIETVPAGAVCAIDTFHVVTPTTITLKRGSGSRRVVCKLDGYEDGVGRFLDEYGGFVPEFFTNVLFGVLPGMLVDDLTGADSNLSPVVLVVRMKPIANISAGMPGSR